MTAKSYYITTLGDWQRHAGRFAHSHFVALGTLAGNSAEGAAANGSAQATGGNVSVPAQSAAAGDAPDPATRILVLVEADEGVHISLEDDAAFEALPHPLAAKPISGAAQSALAAHGVAEGATMFDAAEALARVHPLLRHRVF